MEERKLREKLAGRIKFPEDISTKKMIYGKLIRSTLSRGKILSITFPDMPDNYYFIKADDIPGENIFKLPFGQMPFLAENEVFYKGEPVAAICGPNPEVIEKLINETLIEYQPLAPIGSFSLDRPDFISYQRTVTRGDIQKVFDNDQNISIEDYYETPLDKADLYPLNEGFCQRDGSKYQLHAMTQWPSMLLNNGCTILDTTPSKLRIKRYPCENSQDSRLWYSSLSSLYASLLSAKSKRSVKMLIDTAEEFQSMPGRSPAVFYFHGSCDRNGKLLALKVDFAIDSGAYPLLAEEIVDEIISGCSGVYQCSNLEINGRALRTCSAPTGGYNGFGLSQVLFALELFVNRLAENTELSPYEWKMLNFVEKGNRLSLGSPLKTTNSLKQIVENLVSDSDFCRKHASYRLPSHKDLTTSFHRGIGISCGFLGTDFLNSNKELTSLPLEMILKSGTELDILIPAMPGHKQLFKFWNNIIMEQLGIEPQNIEYKLFDKKIMSGPSSVGRNAVHLTRLLLQGCQQLNKRRFRDPLPIIYEKKWNRTGSKWEASEYIGKPYYDLSWGGVIVEVNFNLECNLLEIKHIWLVLDAGKIVDRPLAQTVVESGIREALKWCGKDMLFTPVPDPPPYTIHFIEDSKNPKALDGLVQNCFPAALTEAIIQATEHQVNSLPITLEKLFHPRGNK